MNQDEIAELKRQFAEHASWGFVSRYGRTGRILSVRADDQTLEITTPRGILYAHPFHHAGPANSRVKLHVVHP